MKRYLIISDASSMHIYNYIHKCLLGRGWEIVILSHSTTRLPDRNKELYDANGIRVIDTSDCDFKNKRGVAPAIKKFFYKYRQLKKTGKFDVCQIHYLNIYSCLLYLLCKNNIKHLILTFWGSDILVPDKLRDFVQKICFKHADFISLTVSHTLNVFHQKFGTQYDDKVSIIRFIGGALEDIKSLKANKSNILCKEEMGIEPHKIVVTVGYNALPAQHQDKYVDCLATMNDYYKANLHLIIPLQYGRIYQSYIEDVKKCVKDSGFSYTVLEDYMNYNDMARLSLATDIYVNARETDAFSNAMKEMLYAGAYMIQGSWLTYKELDDIKWPRGYINKAEDLPEQVKMAIEYIKNNNRKSCQFVWDTWSPECVRKQWDIVFERIIN